MSGTGLRWERMTHGIEFAYSGTVCAGSARTLGMCAWRCDVSGTGGSAVSAEAARAQVEAAWMEWWRAAGLTPAGEVRRLREALLDALATFDVGEGTRFRDAYRDVIERAQMADGPEATASAAGGWRPIAEAPRDGREIPCRWPWSEPDEWRALQWKYNRRTGLSYFGDPIEMDDYDLPFRQPSHYHPLSSPRSVEPAPADILSEDVAGLFDLIATEAATGAERTVAMGKTQDEIHRILEDIGIERNDPPRVSFRVVPAGAPEPSPAGAAP